MEIAKITSIKRDAEALLKKADELLRKVGAHNEQHTGFEPIAFKEFREAGDKLRINLSRNLRRPQPAKAHISY
jgi:hypothetical protein